MINERPEAQSHSISSRALQEKNWEEMGLEEKIERLKRLVDAHTRRLQELDHYWCLIREHSHQGDKTVVPIAIR